MLCGKVNDLLSVSSGDRVPQYQESAGTASGCGFDCTVDLVGITRLYRLKLEPQCRCYKLRLLKTLCVNPNPKITQAARR